MNRLGSFSLVFVVMLTTATLSLCAEGGPGEMNDIEIGAPGSGPGEMLELRDIAFGPDDRLYVLEGRRFDNQTKQWTGNCRVQIFDNQGKFLDQFAISREGLGPKAEKADPSRLAVDSRSRVFVTKPETGSVFEFRRGAEWKQNARHEIDGAFALCVWKSNGRERIAVLSRKREKNQWLALNDLRLLDADSGQVESLKLSQGVAEVHDMAGDANGRLCILGAVNQLYLFDADGKLKETIGAGTTRRLTDGSELRDSVAIDPQGRIHAMAWGRLARFEADLQTVGVREGKFYWYDSWSPHSAYTPIAFDSKGRFWAGATGNKPRGERHHFRPCVLRAKESFFQQLEMSPTLASGFDPTLTTQLVENIAYDLSPIELTYTVPAASRRINKAAVEYRVYDVYKTAVATGRFTLKLVDKQEASQTFSFTPPRYGWYEVECHATTADGRPIRAVGAHVGVTPEFPSMHTLVEGESTHSWIDPAKQAFCGLRLMRLHTGQDIEVIEKTLAQAEKLGLTLLVQFENAKQCELDRVREVVGRLKGRVKYWEIVNEPNFTFTPEKYAELVKAVAPLVKEIDPQAKVMGPTVCGINLDWHEKFFAAGGGPLLDIISIHDYEGNEAIDPGHWRWKIGQLREMMARYKLGDRTIWQTERAIGGVRMKNFQGGVQAIRIGLQRDVLETLGIPNEHNLHYYVNQAGYGSVPTYIWSKSGPHPAALTLRTREAMVLGRKFAGTLDFGPAGNRVFMALRFHGDDGETIVVRQLGAAIDPTVTLNVQGGTTVEIVDSFGNRRTQAVENGKVTLTVPALPLYLRLAKGRSVTPPSLDFGPNLAADATVGYAGETESDPRTPVNGIFEVTHPSTAGPKPWKGVPLVEPQEVTLTWPEAKSINRVEVYSMRADNPWCYLVDFDVQYNDGRDWVTLREVRTPLSASDLVRTAECQANTWYNDQNFAIVDFPAVTTGKLRVVARKTTHGFQPDAVAVTGAGREAGKPTLHLREIMVFGPQR